MRLLTGFLLSSAAASIYLFKTAIHHRVSPELSGHTIMAYRWRSLPRVPRHRASKPQGSSEQVLPWQIPMDQLICTSLSHTHYWYEVGMLKVQVACTLFMTPLSLLKFDKNDSSSSNNSLRPQLQSLPLFWRCCICMATNVVCCFSHSAYYWLPIREKERNTYFIYTVRANPAARGLLNSEKRAKKEILAAHPPTHPSPSPRARYSFGGSKKNKKTQGAYNKENEKNRWPEGHHVTHLDTKALRRSWSASLPYRAPSARRLGLGQLVLLLRMFYASSVNDNHFFPVSVPLSFSPFLAMSNRIYLFFPLRGHELPPTLRDRLNPHLCFQHRRFPIPRYAKPPDVALFANNLPFLLPTPSSRSQGFRAR